MRDNIYIQIIGKSFKSKQIYNMNILVNICSGFLAIFVQMELWKALYSNGIDQATSLIDAITYTLINSLIIKKCFFNISDYISGEIYNGNIEVDLIQPISIKKILVLKTAGQNIFDILTFSIPVMLIMLALYDIKAPFSIKSFFSFVLVTILGQIIFLLLEFLLGYSAFWLKTNWYIAYIKLAMMTVFAGMAIPLWFYPKWLETVCNILPFKHIGYEAIYIYLYGTSQQDFFKEAFIQLTWIIVLFFCEKIIWKKAIKKIEIYGG